MISINKIESIVNKNIFEIVFFINSHLILYFSKLQLLSNAIFLQASNLLNI